MATLALGALGAAAGSALLPAGLDIFGASIAGSALGSQFGSLVGAQIDQALFGTGAGRAVDGPRLSDLRVTVSTEGAPIPRLYGRARLGGQIIWATALDEEAVDRKAQGGGKGGRASSTTGVDYAYYANFAVALCEGVVTSLGRVWADGREISLNDFTVRLHHGSETQDPDPLLEIKQGGSVPSYRGVAYLVFERMPLALFGNRVPQLSFEVFRAVDTVESDLKGVVLIPGSGEFVYAQAPVNHTVGRITSVSENVHSKSGNPDWETSLDQLESNLPNVKSVSLVVSWFGSDLRAGHCQLRPAVERTTKLTSPISWSVAGVSRASATVVSQHEGRPAYGGTPSDQTVVGAIQDLRARGLSVVFSPFILMDIPQSNTLPDPNTTAAFQPAYPWRGRITVTPAPGRAGTPDKTSAATAQITSFIGAAQAADFAITGLDVDYSGPAEWSFRRFILHYAHLCKAAGGVDAFVLGSELRGLTSVRNGASSYPVVAALVQLAADVRAILGPTVKILYAADWSEYFGHQPADSSNDVHFHLDPLWASPDIDAIGIDVYWPLADWRDGAAHRDALAGVASTYDLDYLKSGFTAGEGFAWYYASDADRIAQRRTPITDAGGKPWMFRFKDLKAWWSNAHYNRTGGVASSAATGWVPQSKPFWFMEIGCPAIDKGANQPNVFIDAKSSESFIPHFSTGARDDFIQRRVLQAYAEAFDPAHPGTVPGLNPVSIVTGQRMVDPARIHVYCWDARPFPAFPSQGQIWGDGANWRLGHWLNGRTAAAPLPALVAKILTDTGFTDFDVSHLTGSVVGIVLDRIMTAREALQPLELGFFFDPLETGGTLVFRPRGHAQTALALDAAHLVETRTGADLMRLTRTQDSDLPASAKVGYIAAQGDYAQAIAEARRVTGASGRVSTAALGVVLNPDQADAIAESWLFEAWAARERASFTVPPSLLRLEPGDTVTLNTGTRTHTLRITEVGDHGARDIDARSIDDSVYRLGPATPRDAPPSEDTPSGSPLVVYLDLPPGTEDQAHVGLVAAAQAPWPGSIAIYRSPETTNFALSVLLPRAAITGLTAVALPPGVASRFNHGATLAVTLDRGVLTSTTTLGLLSGSNLAAVETATNVWQIIQFQTATLVAPQTYQLATLLRGQRGTEHALSTTIPVGARFILLDEAVRPVAMSVDDVGLAFNWKAGPARNDIGAPSTVDTVQSFTGPGLRPLSPVHIKATRNAAGDLSLTWIRRTRLNGDSWSSAEVPLGESAERYDIDIMSNAAATAIKRTLTATSTAAFYPLAEQIADFGSQQNAVTVRIAQRNPEYGRGSPATATV